MVGGIGGGSAIPSAEPMVARSCGYGAGLFVEEVPPWVGAVSGAVKVEVG